MRFEQIGKTKERIRMDVYEKTLTFAADNENQFVLLILTIKQK